MILGIALSATSLGAGVAFAAVNNSNYKMKEATAAVPTNTRRIWIIDNNGGDSSTSWWTGSTMYVYVWNGSGSNTYKVEHKVLDDYYKGYWYVDISFASVTTSVNVIVRVGDSSNPYGWGNNNQTFTQSLGALGEADTIWLNNGVTWDSSENRNSRNASIGTSNGFSGAQLASVLSHFDTCSSANTNGYNAYPQMETNVFLKTTQSAFSTKVYGQDTYTCQDYVDGMYTRYNANK